MSADDGAGTREVARRLFAAEYDDTTLSYSESDEERAPNYVVTPTGARVNRLFAVGVLTATESVNDDMLRARIVDPTGAFVAYAGQYQPDALAFFERSTPPAFVALTAKARTFQPEDSEQVFTSARPETVNEIDDDTRDRWTVSAAEATLRRVSLFDAALSSGLRGDDLEAHLREHGVEGALATGIPRAIDHYGTTTAYLDAVRQLALDALAVVAGEREEVRELSLAPDEGGAAALGQIPADLRAEDSIATPEASVESTPTGSTDAASATADASAPATDASSPAADASSPAADATASTATDSAADTASSAASTGSDGTETASDAATDAASAASADATADAASDASADAASTTASGEASAETAAPEETTDADSGSEAQSDSTASDDLGAFDDSLSDEVDASTEDEAATDDPNLDESGDVSADTDASADADATADTDTAADADAATDANATADAEEPADAADIDVAEDDLYEFDEEEREAVREEHGLSFESGAEVGSPGEAGIETPDVDETDAESLAGESTETEDVTTGAAEPEIEESATADTETEAVDADATEADEPAADADLTVIVVDVMDDLDEGDGADREQVIAAVVQRSGTDPGAAEDAIQEALMDGKCYEPGEGRLKAI